MYPFQLVYDQILSGILLKLIEIEKGTIINEIKLNLRGEREGENESLCIFKKY